MEIWNLLMLDFIELFCTFFFVVVGGLETGWDGGGQCGSQDERTQKVTLCCYINWVLFCSTCRADSFVQPDRKFFAGIFPRAIELATFGSLNSPWAVSSCGGPPHHIWPMNTCAHLKPRDASGHYNFYIG